MASANATLERTRFASVNANGDEVGLPISEDALIVAGSSGDAADGTSGEPGDKPDPELDVNDVVSSQGVRLGQYEGLDGWFRAGSSRPDCSGAPHARR